jgi:hypothetical protein
MASKVLTSQEFTHLLFIDTDMAFNPSAVQKMIDSQLDVIGCAYPYRTIPLHEKPASAELSYRESLSKSVPYAVNFPAGTKTIDIKNGICKVDSVGTGLMLISRQALHTLVAESKVKEFSVGFPYNQWYSQARYHGFFEHLEIDGVYFSEDYSFCYRWRALCQREIWAVVDEEIMHIGPMPVLGRYVEKLSSGKL